MRFGKKSGELHYLLFVWHFHVGVLRGSSRITRFLKVKRTTAADLSSTVRLPELSDREQNGVDNFVVSVSPSVEAALCCRYACGRANVWNCSASAYFFCRLSRVRSRGVPNTYEASVSVKRLLQVSTLSPPPSLTMSPHKAIPTFPSPLPTLSLRHMLTDLWTSVPRSVPSPERSFPASLANRETVSQA